MSLVPIATIKGIMLESLKDYAAENGFTINKSDFSLNRRTNNCKQTLLFLPYYYVETSVKPVVYITIPTIESICERCGFVYGGWVAQLPLLCAEKIYKELEKLEERQASSEECHHKIGMIRGNYTHRNMHPDSEFVVWEESDVYQACEKIHTQLPYAQKFFERYNGLESIDRIYNALPIRWDYYCICISAQAICGIIAAYVMKNSEYYEIKQGYLELFRLKKPVILEFESESEAKERHESSINESRGKFLKICDYLEGFDSVEAMLKDLKEFKKKKK